MSLALRVLVGLVAGFLLGLALAGSTSGAAVLTLQILAPIGGIFVNLIRMTAIPLVVSMLIASVGTMGASGSLGRTGVRALLVSLALLTAASIGTALIAVPVIGRLTIDQAAALALRGPGTTSGATASAPGMTQWLIDLVPQNVFKAANDGAMLPVIFFAVLFGLALTRGSEANRLAVLRVVDGVAEAMQRIVVWILALAPIGVFALAVPLAARLGLSAVGAVAAYIGLVVALTVIISAVLLYPLGILAGPMTASRFLAYLAPGQAIAFASRSSLAALPAMLQSAERVELSPTASRVVLPLAVSVFHFGAAVAQTVGAIFLAHLFGVTLAAPQLTAVVLAVILATFAVPGIPGGSIIAMVPVLSAAGLPLEGIGILLAVDTIPDMFRTTANATGAMTLAAILSPRTPPRDV